jgi:D-alanine-D-alanine ligase
MKRRSPRDILADLLPIYQVPITWDASGYTTPGFEEEVRQPSFTGWDGDLVAEEEAATIVRLLNPKRGQMLIDVACGYGRHALLFDGTYGLRVTGLDISQALLERARANAREEGLFIEYIQAHARDLRFTDRFDFATVIHNSFSLFSDQDAPRVLRAIHRALKPGGKLFLDIDNKPYLCRYGTCYRNWFMSDERLTLRDVHYHEDTSVEVTRDITMAEDFEDAGVFIWFKRIYSREEITALLNSCGFEIVSLHGYWDNSACNNASPKLIITAAKA